MSESIEVRAGDLDEVEAEGREILERRKDEVVDGLLDGKHWFYALLEQARAVVRRRRTIAERRSSRT